MITAEYSGSLALRKEWRRFVRSGHQSSPPCQFAENLKFFDGPAIEVRQRSRPRGSTFGPDVNRLINVVDLLVREFVLQSAIPWSPGAKVQQNRRPCGSAGRGLSACLQARCSKNDPATNPPPPGFISGTAHGLVGRTGLRTETAGGIGRSFFLPSSSMMRGHGGFRDRPPGTENRSSLSALLRGGEAEIRPSRGPW